METHKADPNKNTIVVQNYFEIPYYLKLTKNVEPTKSRKIDVAAGRQFRGARIG